MNIISNVFSYIYSVFQTPTQINHVNNTDIIDEQPLPTILDENEVYHIFINTANIYNASYDMLTKLNNNYDNDKYIKIYLLKSHTLEPLFKTPIKINDNNLKLIKQKISTKRRHLHTCIESINSFIEYNNIKNYSIYY